MDDRFANWEGLLKGSESFLDLWCLVSLGGRNGRTHGKKQWGVKAAVWYVAGMVEELLCMKVESNSQRATSRTRWKAPE